MNAWLRQMARQQVDKDLIKIYVATTADDSTKIAGYYAINTTSVLTEGMGGQKLPSSVPAVLLARLAVDASYKGQGLGGYLLMNALELAAETAELVGIRCIVVDAIDDNAAQFYQHFGFEPLTTDPNRLVLHLQTVRVLLQEGS